MKLELRPTLTRTGFTILLFALMCAPHTVHAKRASRKWRVPLVMEEATVRGKVVVLETRTAERMAVKNLRVQVWSHAEAAADKDADQTRRTDEQKTQLLNETKTDAEGFFTLPLLEVGEYLLIVGELQLRLAVVPRAPTRSGQAEPKILLLLVPKEVLWVQE